ncbi:MAG: hypothetical protein HUU57_07795 [Bdellovibrio sp.]|nr:hypothetical protein [Bdellovibrio sp.]
MRCWLVLLFLFSGLHGWTHEVTPQNSTAYLRRLVDSYYTQRASLPRPLPEPPTEQPPGSPGKPPLPAPPPPNRCVPNASPSECVEAVCQQVIRFECDEPHELAEVTRACRNVDPNCVRSICSRVSRFDCDDRSEVLQAADACRGVQDPSCIGYVCSRLNRFDCDELRELIEVARQCR